MALGDARAKLAALAPPRQAAVERLAREPGWLDTVCGPELWVTVPGVSLGFEIFGMGERPLVIDLNTATAPFLMAFPGIGWAQAEALRLHRASSGGLSTLGDLRAVDGFGDRLVEALGSARWEPQGSP